MKLFITAAAVAASVLIVEATDCALRQPAEGDSVATLGFRTLYSAPAGKG